MPPFVGEGHAGGGTAVVVGPELLLVAGRRLHALGLLRSHLLQPLIILCQVHISALSGIHDLFLRDTGSGMLQRGLCLSGGWLGGGNRTGRGRSRLLGLSLRGGGPLRLGRLFGRNRSGSSRSRRSRHRRSRNGRGLFLFLRLLIGISKNLLNAGHRMGLGQGLKHQRQFVVGQCLHIALGSFAVLSQNLHHVLVVQAEILSQLSDSVFVRCARTQ
ncbi:hypothetical protein SDC9_103793 [bioreactor metagenome]|uniref:Uncharacterized protein n=1 Tax=bioreactor metagenome TaxID=1076179 RepID=A0A645AW05_9ZZZZ